MRQKPSQIAIHRAAVENSLRPWRSLINHPKPSSGWIKTIRAALGITSKQLAERMGIAQANVIAIEEREVLQTVTLATLEKAAHAMNCQLIYALVPNEEIKTESLLPFPVAPTFTALKPESDTEDEIALLQRSLRNPK